MKTFSKNQKRLLEKLQQSINEVTITRKSSGSYDAPLQSGLRNFNDKQLGPFTVSTTKYTNTELNYDNHDGEMDHSEDEIRTKEFISKLVSKYNENKSDFDQFDEFDEFDEETINEDLGVWFGTKKKPKGSKQPKGPWVNICKKVDGKHPPCGRSDADTKSYPKCRAAGVAGKMSDDEKKAACSQKRRAEKKDPKHGKGNKPTMTSYKPKNESYLDNLIKKVIQEEIFKNY